MSKQLFDLLTDYKNIMEGRSLERSIEGFLSGAIEMDRNAATLSGEIHSRSGLDRAAAEMESRAQAQDTEEEDLCASCGHPVEFHETPWGTSHTCDVEGASDRQCGCTQFVPKTPFDERLEGDQE